MFNFEEEKTLVREFYLSDSKILQVTPDKHHGFFKASYKSGGDVPESLSGLFTSVDEIELALKRHLNSLSIRVTITEQPVEKVVLKTKNDVVKEPKKSAFVKEGLINVT